MSNPYLDEAGHSLSDFNFELRRELVKKYSWAIPSEDALDSISKYSGIVEMGAGSGYWSKLLQDRGVSILPFDLRIGEDNTYGHKNAWTHIYQGGDEVLHKFALSVNLFLCWPPHDQSMAYDCLSSFRGRHVIYIGEGWGGCTGDDRFHEELETKWDEILYKDIPQWYGLHDVLYIYKRKRR